MGRAGEERSARGRREQRGEQRSRPDRITAGAQAPLLAALAGKVVCSQGCRVWADESRGDEHPCNQE